MWRAGVLSVFLLLSIWGGPKPRLWQEAQVVRIESSTLETEEANRALSTGEGGSFPPVNGIIRRRTRTWTYALRTAGRMYTFKVTRKPLEGIQEGDPVRIFVKSNDLYLLGRGGKERKLELLSKE